MERFEGKKYYSTDTNEAINTPVETLNKTINSKNIFNGSSGGDTFSSKNKKGFMKHFLNGVSHMIPFIVFSGIVWAILQAIAMGI
jgi:PTS system fructose-specific IIC component